MINFFNCTTAMAYTAVLSSAQSHSLILFLCTHSVVIHHLWH